MVTVRGMMLGELLQQHGIVSAAELGRRLNIARQHAWLLWTGRHLPSYELLQRLAGELNIEPQALAQLERAKLPKNGRRRKGGRPPKRPSEDGSAPE
jgi:transcriptional regulator with XRE-family HTH domain